MSRLDGDLDLPLVPLDFGAQLLNAKVYNPEAASPWPMFVLTVPITSGSSTPLSTLLIHGDGNSLNLNGIITHGSSCTMAFEIASEHGIKVSASFVRLGHYVGR